MGVWSYTDWNHSLSHTHDCAAQRTVDCAVCGVEAEVVSMGLSADGVERWRIPIS